MGEWAELVWAGLQPSPLAREAFDEGLSDKRLPSTERGFNSSGICKLFLFLFLVLVAFFFKI